jgi:hypothetical protein
VLVVLGGLQRDECLQLRILLLVLFHGILLVLGCNQHVEDQ